MGMPAILKQTGVGRSTVWSPDFFQDPFNIGIGCVVSGGAATYNIEHTFDDANTIAGGLGSVTWFQNSGITGATANANGNYQFPVRFISINVTGGTGTVTATLIQANAAKG
jgi:hypothetical protein